MAQKSNEFSNDFYISGMTALPAIQGAFLDIPDLQSILFKINYGDRKYGFDICFTSKSTNGTCKIVPDGNNMPKTFLIPNKRDENILEITTILANDVKRYFGNPAMFDKAKYPNLSELTELELFNEVMFDIISYIRGIGKKGCIISRPCEDSDCACSGCVARRKAVVEYNDMVDVTIF